MISFHLSATIVRKLTEQSMCYVLSCNLSFSQTFKKTGQIDEEHKKLYEQKPCEFEVYFI